MPFGEFFGSAGPTAKTATMTFPREAAMTANLTLVVVWEEPIKLAAYTEPTPSWSPRCAPFSLVTKTTSCHRDDGRPDTMDCTTASGLPPFIPVTWTSPSLVLSVTPLASCARTVHADW